MGELLSWLSALPLELVYVLLAVGAALENVVPAVPADTAVALGGLLSAVGRLDAGTVFVVTWLANVASGLVTYRVGYTHGRAFFEHGWGRRLLAPHQMRRMEAFYRRWGLPAIFLTRFVPGVRAVVPVFAGVTHHRFLPVAVPLALASAIWYAGLVWLGAVAGRNLSLLTELLGQVNGTLAAVAGVLLVLVLLWWWRTRHPPDDEER